MHYDEFEYVIRVLAQMMTTPNDPDTKAVIKLLYENFPKGTADEMLSIARDEASIGGRA
jgi:hypothetical protein